MYCANNTDLKAMHNHAFYKCIMGAQKAREEANSIRSQYHLLILFDPLLLFEFNSKQLNNIGEIGSTFMENLSRGTIQEIVNCCFQIVKENITNELVVEEAFRVTLRPIYVPDCLVNSQDLANVSGICHFSGTVVSIQLPRYILISQLFRCENKECRNANCLTIIHHPEFKLIKRSAKMKILGVSNQYWLSNKEKLSATLI